MARHIQYRSQLILTKTSSRCHFQFAWCSVLFFRISLANFNPKRHSFVTDTNSTFVQNIFKLAVTERIPHVKHHWQADDFRRIFKAFERVFFWPFAEIIRTCSICQVPLKTPCGCFYALNLQHLTGHVEIHSITAVIALKPQHASISSLDRVNTVWNTRSGKDISNCASINQPRTAVAHKNRQVL